MHLPKPGEYCTRQDIEYWNYLLLFICVSNCFSYPSAHYSMWQAIANQSKQDGGQDASGAGDAADWAISRSLNAMNTPGEQPTRTINDIADEESSDASQYESGSYGPSARSPDFKGSMV